MGSRLLSRLIIILQFRTEFHHLCNSITAQMRNRSRDKPKTTNVVSRLPASRLPDLIHIEGDRDGHCPRAPQGAAAEAGSPHSRAPLPAQRPPAQPASGVSKEDGTAGCRTSESALPSERERRGSLGRGVQLGPGMTTSHISNITIR